jgi:hypothetical protein
MRRGFRRTTEDNISLSFLDLLSNGVGAAIVLLLIFTIARGLAPHMSSGGSDLIRARFSVRDLTHGWSVGARPIVAITVEANGVPVSLSVESVDGQDIRQRVWSRNAFGPLAPTPVSVGAYPSRANAEMRDYDVVVENPGDVCWKFSVRFVDRERRLGYEGDERGIEVYWMREGRQDGSSILLPNKLSPQYGLRLIKKDRLATIQKCAD